MLRLGLIKRRTLVLSAALMLIGGSVGAVGARELPVLAATPTPTSSAASTSPRQQRQEQFLSTLAGKLNVSVDQLKQAISDTRKELGMPDHPLGPGGLRGRGHRPGGGPGAFAPRPGGPFGAALDAAATAIGIPVDQLRQELASSTLQDVATAHGKNPKDVADALKAEATQRIDQAVSAGRLTSDRANQLKQQLDNRIQFVMTHTFPPFRPHGRGGPHGPSVQQPAIQEPATQ